MKYSVFLLTVVLMLSACSNGTSQETANASKNYELSIWKSFSLQAPFIPSKKYLRDDGSIAWLSYEDFGAHRKEGDIAIELYENEESCSEDLLGIWHPQKWEKGVQAIWGRVDYFDTQPDYVREPLCRPFVNGEAYGFCAEKGEVTAVVCIAQATDNPQLAEDIFNTFKWTE